MKFFLGYLLCCLGFHKLKFVGCSVEPELALAHDEYHCTRCPYNKSVTYNVLARRLCMICHQYTDQCVCTKEAP